MKGKCNMEKIVKAVPQNLALYTLTALNLLYAIHKRSFDWLLWASVGLTAATAALSIISKRSRNA